MPVSRKKHHGSGKKPTGTPKAPVLLFGGHIGKLPPELQTAIREKLTARERELLEKSFIRTEIAGSAAGSKEIAALLWCVSLRIAYDRLGADVPQLAMMTQLADEYLEDVRDGRLTTENIRTSLLTDGLDLSGMFGVLNGKQEKTL